MNKIDLPDNVRREFEAIVGARFVTTDPAMLAGHIWCVNIAKVHGAEKFPPNWPIAAVLPSSTEEVAAVVKCCVRHGLKYRPHSTGYGSGGQTGTTKSVVIDLRRMNTLEIDPKNRMAILGPYVTAGMLQAEALKHGMTCHIVGAGPAHSPLASATSMVGVGITSQGTSMNVRNLLAWEWVTPEGDIVRGGAAGAGCGWFSGEGPGPGTRGLLRGLFGGQGALGVFTKIGYKLYPVPVKGPLEETGRRPQLGARIPENAGFFQVVWPDWESHRAASFELVDENVCFAMLRMPPDHIGWTLTASNAEYVKQVRESSLGEPARQDATKNWTLLTLSHSPAEHAWRTGVVKEIVQRTGGRILDLPIEEAEVLHRNLFTSIYVPRALRPAGGMGTSFGVMDSLHFLPNVMESGEEHLAGKNGVDGPLITGGKEEHWAWPQEGRYFWSENIIQYDPRVKAARVTAIQALLEHFPIVWKNHAGLGVCALGPLMELQGDSIGAPQDYIRAVKHYYDPKNSSWSPDFIPFTIPKLLQKVLPVLRPVLTSKPVIKFIARGMGDKGM